MILRQLADSYVHSEWSWIPLVGSMQGSCEQALKARTAGDRLTEHVDLHGFSPSPSMASTHLTISLRG